MKRKVYPQKNVLNEIKVLLQYPKQSYKLFFNKTTGAKSRVGPARVCWQNMQRTLKFNLNLNLLHLLN